MKNCVKRMTLGDQAEYFQRKAERLQAEAERALETFYCLSEQSVNLIREALGTKYHA